MGLTLFFWVAILIQSTICSSKFADTGTVSLLNSVIVPASNSREYDPSVEILQSAALRANIRTGYSNSDSFDLNPAGQWPSDLTIPVISLLLDTNTSCLPEGYILSVFPDGQGNHTGPIVQINGCDARGIMYGAGFLLRQTVMLVSGDYIQPRKVVCELNLPQIRNKNYRASWSVQEAPAFVMRGHLLSYRAISNSYDGWDVPTMREFVRDLIVFGMNQLECVAPDDKNSPHFHLTQIDAIIAMSQLAQDFYLNFSIWYPATAPDLEQVVGKVKRLDSLFIPSGDPGSLGPKDFLQVAEKKASMIAKVRPELDHPIIWISCQEWNVTELQEFFKLLSADIASTQKWLAGIVYGPHSSLPLKTIRQLLPSAYQLRNYPDLGHGLKAQYPNPNWFDFYAFTEAREIVNPRPVQMASIIAQSQLHTIGFGGYSDGCNDDVNKMIWSALHFTPSLSIDTVLEQYGRYFWAFQSSLSENSQGSLHGINFRASTLLKALEHNWNGSRIDNVGVNTQSAESAALETLELWQKVEDIAQASFPNRLQRDWRFQMYMYRAYYDAYQSSRAAWEKVNIDQSIISILSLYRNASQGVSGALTRARNYLDSCLSQTRRKNQQHTKASRTISNIYQSDLEVECPDEWASVHPDWYTKLWQYAEALFNSIGMQLSVPNFGSEGIGRAASMDTVHVPLCNQRWLKLRINQLLAANVTHEEQVQGVEEIINWESPKSLLSDRSDSSTVETLAYDNLGIAGQQPHLVFGDGPEVDPSYYSSALLSFMEPFNVSTLPVWPYTWYSWAETLYQAPLQVHYSDKRLDPSSTNQYQIRFVFGNGATGSDELVRMDAITTDGKAIPMLPYQQKPSPPIFITVKVPNEAITDDGQLTIQWRSSNDNGSGRGCQISEVWLQRIR